MPLRSRFLDIMVTMDYSAHGLLVCDGYNLLSVNFTYGPLRFL